MDNKIWFHQPIQPVKRPITSTPKTSTQQPTKNFNDVFQKTLETTNEPVKFSTHAMKRINERGINMTESDISKLDNAIKKAALKGSKDALVIMNQVAYVVSVNNKTVVTAMDEKSTKENVFTNIDSAIIL
ncbi:TIGR02530 family flagellar biosynthesis protein [Desulfuribacillus alkaliarsenatis]|uniref:Flagellar protein n=1 Tax=Desulfuribacillus alkaliarsenatis TaxID=766136 RepID=A0A1E5G608_9FIRM|nr:TIGR02530 family flagellar biosynthesis protein [Desulfuribacillus alkaliarsenatis]OEF98612.1 hypothetical protein BHF68_02810 [Desulfuribacillus alkaliarsenatis]